MSELEALGAFLEVIPDAVFVVGEDGVIAAVNGEAEALSGRAREELVGSRVESLVPPRLAEAHVVHRQGYIATARRRTMGSGLDIHMLRKDGVEIPVDISLSPLTLEGRRYAIASMRDTTEQRIASDQIQAALAVAQASLEGGADTEVLRLIAARARALSGARMALVVQPEPDGPLVVSVADGEGSGRVEGFRIGAAEQSLSREVMAGGEPILVADLMTDPRASVALNERLQVHSAICVPLKRAAYTFGTLLVGDPPAGRAFEERDVPPLVFLATQASLALEHLRLQEEVQRLALVDERERIGRELHDGAIQAIFAIGMSLEGLAARTVEPELAERLRGTVAQLDGVIRDLRSYIYGLRPGLVARQELEQALRQLVDDFAASSEVTAVAEIEPDAAAALAPHAADVVLLATEALSNVGRHAQALTCRLSLRGNGSNVVLEIEDDGRGFDVRAGRAGGQGLRNLRERAEHLGGTAEVESELGQGATIRFTLPLPE